jgi:hypothetical protein
MSSGQRKQQEGIEKEDEPLTALATERARKRLQKETEERARVVKRVKGWKR